MIRSASSGVPHRVTFTNGAVTASADVPEAKGGRGDGFGPHELVEAALATCLAITCELYAEKHAIPLESVAVEVRLDRGSPPDVLLVYSLAFRGALSDDQRSALRSAASRCPVQKTLAGGLICRAEE